MTCALEGLSARAFAVEAEVSLERADTSDGSAGDVLNNLGVRNQLNRSIPKTFAKSGEFALSNRDDASGEPTATPFLRMIGSVPITACARRGMFKDVLATDPVRFGRSNGGAFPIFL